MNSNTHAKFLSVVAMSGVLAACGAVGDEPTGVDTEAVVVHSGEESRTHLLAVRGAEAPPPAGERAGQAVPHLNYYGGPVLKNVQVYPVYWRATPGCSTTIAGGYTCFVGSSIYTSLLPQYSGIGTGTNHAAYLDTGAPAGFAVTDAKVQTELIRLMNLGAIPLPNANNYYPVHFPAGYSITDSGGAKSCVVFCAYHGTFKVNVNGVSTNVNYGIMPDMGSGGCQNGCGSSTVCNNTTSVMSHELVEATTDPAVGLATVYGPPLAWYDPINGEIGDICSSQSAIVCANGTFRAQTEWSNFSNACKVVK